MSSQSRSRDYEISRSSPYVSKSREVDGRKRDAYTSRGDGGTVSEKHRSAPYSSKSSRRSIDDRKDPYISSSERRDPESSKRERDNYSSGASREIYSKVGRDRDYSFESRERERAPFLSRGRSHASRGHRDSYSSHGPRESFHPRGGRDSFGSRGNYGNRGHRDSFSSRGNFGSRESFSRGNYMSVRGNKDYSRGSYGSRGGRDSYSSRGSFGNRGGRDSFSSRGNYFGSRGGRINFSRGARGLGRGFRGSNRGLRSDPFMSHFDSRAQLKLTEKLVASVLEDSEEDFRDEKPYRVKEHKEGRSYNPRESERHFKEPSRSFSHHSSYSHGDKLIKRERSSSSAHFDKERFIYSEKSKMKIKDKFREAPSKRVHEEEEIDEDERPPLKHMRLSKRDKYHDPISSSSHRFEERSSSYSPSRDEHSSHRLFNSKEEEEGRVRRSRERTRKTEKEKRPSESEEVKRSEEREIAEEVESVKVKRKFSRDEELEEEFEESHHRKSSPTGMQVTVRSDGERAVNSKGSVKSRITSRKFFIELQCPHCPEERSYTFRDYKFHLVSHNHKIKIRNLLHKHSIVLRRIRQKQRAEQKEKEDKWEVDNPEEFKTTVSRYCYTCKLAFKCLPADESAEGITEHNASKLHKVQHLYTFPRCDLCGVKPPSRLAYEIHLVSIRHLRMASMSRENRREISEEDHAHDDANIGEREELDLANFITMDSVGEDEEAGSEHEDMLGDPEDIKKAEEEAKEGEDDDEHEEHHGEEDDAEKSHPYDGDDDLELELDHEIGEDLDMSDEEREVCGKEFLVPLEAFYCKLCHKAIRIDTPLGETALDRHCTSSLHIENFHYLNSEEYGEEQRENFDEEQLAEEEEAEEEEEPFCENEEAEPEEPVLIEESDEQGHPEEGSADEDRRVTEEEETDGGCFSIMKVCLLGDSVVRRFLANSDVAEAYSLQISGQGVPGIRLENLISLVAPNLTPTHQILIIFTPVADGWQKESFSGQPVVQIVTPREPSFPSMIESLKMISHLARQINPTCHIYVVLSPIMEIMEYNRSRISKAGIQLNPDELSYLINLAPRLHQHSRQFYNAWRKMAVETTWCRGIDILHGQHTLRAIYQQSVCDTDSLDPFTEYLKGRSSTFPAALAFEDGIHPHLKFCQHFWKRNHRFLSPLPVKYDLCGCPLRMDPNPAGPGSQRLTKNPKHPNPEVVAIPVPLPRKRGLLTKSLPTSTPVKLSLPSEPLLTPEMFRFPKENEDLKPSLVSSAEGTSSPLDILPNPSLQSDLLSALSSDSQSSPLPNSVIKILTETIDRICHLPEVIESQATREDVKLEIKSLLDNPDV